MIGEPGPRERECQANLQEWEAGLVFDRQWGGKDFPKKGKAKPEYDYRVAVAHQRAVSSKQ